MTLDAMIAKAMASDSDPTIARRHLLSMVPAASEDDRDRWAEEWARQRFDQAVRAATLSVERVATTPGRRGRIVLSAENQAALDEKFAATDQRFAEKVRVIMDELTESLRVTWTQELLSSSFATGDGGFTTWGEATLEQHEARMAMHESNAQAAIEGYGRHRQAAGTLRQLSARCLNDALVLA